MSRKSRTATIKGDKRWKIKKMLQKMHDTERVRENVADVIRIEESSELTGCTCAAAASGKSPERWALRNTAKEVMETYVIRSISKCMFGH